MSADLSSAVVNADVYTIYPVDSLDMFFVSRSLFLTAVGMRKQPVFTVGSYGFGCHRMQVHYAFGCPQPNIVKESRRMGNWIDYSIDYQVGVVRENDPTKRRKLPDGTGEVDRFFFCAPTESSDNQSVAVVRLLSCINSTVPVSEGRYFFNSDFPPEVMAMGYKQNHHVDVAFLLHPGEGFGAQLANGAVIDVRLLIDEYQITSLSVQAVEDQKLEA